VCKIFRKTPYRQPDAGRQHTATDLYRVGGIQVVMKELLDAGFLHGDCITVTGKTIAQNLRGVSIGGQDVYRLGADVAHRRRRPHGNLAPEGAIGRSPA
jgi:dihydroxy-acid dehydratase